MPETKDTLVMNGFFIMKLSYDEIVALAQVLEISVDALTLAANLDHEDTKAITTLYNVMSVIRKLPAPEEMENIQ